MAEIWTEWPNYNKGLYGEDGDGPRIGIKTSTSQSATSVSISYYFYLQGRNSYTSYGISGSQTTTWSGYVPTIGNVSGNTKGVWRGSYTDTLKSGTISISRGSTDSSVTINLSIASWLGVKWNNSSGGDNSISLTVSIPKINSLSAPTITTTYSTRIPSQNCFTISWNSVSNAASYYVTLVDSSGAYSNSASVTTTSKTFTVNNLAN